MLFKENTMIESVIKISERLFLRIYEKQKRKEINEFLLENP